MRYSLYILILILSGTGSILAKNEITQTIRGTVVDKVSHIPLTGATVVLIGSNPPIGAVTDLDGEFKLENVPLGRQGLQISFIGYKTVVQNNLLVNSGKELILHIELEEELVKVDEVVITANARKDQPNNKMATVSARSFSVEETEKYAGSRGDIARMAMNFAGVAVANDMRNDIIIRGNSPSGLLWRLDDVDIPNPNHFAEEGTTGGPVGMLNNNTLRNSDFFTAAFPAEYGNALSGVFDLKMRSGNNEKHEFIGQCGFNGFELGAEGPFSKNYKGSYLINARYSTLKVFDIMGISFGTGGVPEYQDVTFKIDLPVTKGKISVFGLAGMSEITMLAEKQDDEDMYYFGVNNLYNGSEMAVSGISYTYFHNDKTYSKLSISGLYQNAHTNIDTLDVTYIIDTNILNSIVKIDTTTLHNAHRYLRHSIADFRVSVNYFINSKINSRLSFKTGIKADRIGYNLISSIYDDDYGDYYNYLKGKKGLEDGVTLGSMYTQWQYKLNSKITFNPGLHFIYFDLNNEYSLEPRVGIMYNVNDKNSINFGYGNHSHIQALKVYFFSTRISPAETIETNKDLKLTKAHHFVIGHDWNIKENLRLKSEVYYQYLYNVPIEPWASHYSAINTGDTWGLDAVDSLVNKGTGYNYGLEFTLEKFLSNGYYFLTTLSLFESKYKNIEGKLFNSVFNGHYVWNGLFGKEFIIHEKNIFSFDLKMTYAGGKYYTPINIEKTEQEGEVVRNWEDKAYSKQNPAFFKADVKVGFRQNKEKYSQEWQLYVENVTNHKNIFSDGYNFTKHEKNYQYQMGFFPLMLYRIYF